jgi:hypothetical protein
LHVDPRGLRLAIPFGQPLRISQGHGRLVYRPTRGCKYERTHLVWKGQYVFDGGVATHGSLFHIERHPPHWQTLLTGCRLPNAPFGPGNAEEGRLSILGKR